MPAAESGEKGFLVSRGRRGRLFPFPSSRARDGRRRRHLSAPARFNSYLTAAAWSVGRAIGRSSPRGCPCRARAPPAAPRAPVTRPVATRAAATRVGMRIRDPAGERAPEARLVAPVRRPSHQAARLGPLGERARATESATTEVGTPTPGLLQSDQLFGRWEGLTTVPRRPPTQSTLVTPNSDTIANAKKCLLKGAWYGSSLRCSTST
ncbi:uncharacterized protein LOC143443667 isoform X2 [Arvicanthis niloticus]|uniref:uncharacterized protein LOC143313969 isoform X2 n=1 Tax=Arvicanthis niloticus TaxID=61156 RepID=UPI00402B1305